MQTEIEITNAVLDGMGIEAIEFNNTFAMNQFHNYITQYYETHKNVSDYTDNYECALAIVACRARSELAASMRDSATVTVAIIRFASALHYAMRAWYRTQTNDYVYTIALRDIVLPFVREFGITYILA